MENSYRFFENRACKYFPCHILPEQTDTPGKEKADTGFNCLFCYCPFYLREHCPGKPSFLERNDRKIKDCSKCTFPHEPENYDVMMQLLREG
ncbi:MAG: cysteine-rich small domain-containing protein [Lachnospiraceae bacterium]|nr:cysteine-rich small domain-containing protein [Lachnospiraceae bacterium]